MEEKKIARQTDGAREKDRKKNTKVHVTLTRMKDEIAKKKKNYTVV